MLYTETLDRRALELLRYIQDSLQGDFRLVGGTALALQLGHRTSVDLDFFGDFPEPMHDTITPILNNYGNTITLQKSKSILIYTVDGIKVDFVSYNHYPWLYPAKVEDGLVLADIRDIAAMKISAITGRGSKKDFWDLHFLLDHFSLRQIIDFYNQKFSDASEFLALKSLIYFTDAEKDLDPIAIKPASWEKVKANILKRTQSLY